MSSTSARSRRAPPRGAAGAARHLPARAAGRAAPGRHRGGDPRPPGRRRRGRDRVGQDDPAAQDLPGARPRRRRADRAHPAAADRRPHGGRADRRGAEGPARRRDRLLGALHRPGRAVDDGAADDRRHPARRDPARPRALALRHDHRRRGPRAKPQHRLPARLPGVAAPPPAGPEAGHHLRDDRHRALRGALRRRAGRGGVRPHLPGRDALPAGGRPGPAGRGGAGPGRRDPRGRRRAARRRARATSSSSSPASARSATPPTRCEVTCARRGRRSRSCRSTRGCRRPSSTGSSRRTRRGGSSWRPTSPRRR